MVKINKFLALILCLVMLVGMVPMQAFATDESPANSNAVIETQNQADAATEDPQETTSVQAPPVEPSQEPTAEPTQEPAAEPTPEPAEEPATEPAPEPTEELATEPSVETNIQTAGTEADVVKVVAPDETVTYYASLQIALDTTFGANYSYAGGNWLFTLLEDTSYAERNIQYPLNSESVNLTIDLSGHTIQGSTGKSVLTINFGNKTSGTLTIQDSVGGGKITGGNHGIFFNGTTSTLNFNGGTITGNHGATQGGGILCNSNTAVVNLNGGTITGNSVTGTSSPNTGLGGGVYGYTINVNGTVITGNEAKGGSGKYSGRGGGIATQITGRDNTVSINTNTVYGNKATNAGDDLMIAKKRQHCSFPGHR